jgi:hypothetical protein
MKKKTARFLSTCTSYGTYTKLKIANFNVKLQIQKLSTKTELELTETVPLQYLSTVAPFRERERERFHHSQAKMENNHL